MGLFYQYWTQRKQLQESEYFTQELSLVINYSSRFLQYPHYPIACCLPHHTSTVAYNCHGKSMLTSRQKERLAAKIFLPRVFFFLPRRYPFCREVFLFAVRLILLPWQLWATVLPTFDILFPKILDFSTWGYSGVRTSTNFAYLTSF